MDREKVVLIGPMGVGKSTLGRVVAKEFGWKYIDNDQDMATITGKSIEELAALPVTELHKIEAKFILDVMKGDAPFISGAAASVIENEEVQQALLNVNAIYLSIPLEEIYLRTSAGVVGRQALNNQSDVIAERFHRRDPLYRKFAHSVLELSKSPEADAVKLAELIR